MWTCTDVHFVMIGDLSGGSVVTVQASTLGGTVLVMGEAIIVGRTVTAGGVHIQGVDVNVNKLGPAALRVIVDALLQEIDCDELIVQGAVRTTGAHPGARPRPIRFTRRPRA